MSEQQWKRLDVIQRVGRGELTRSQAAQVLGVSSRQVRNLVRAHRERGKAGLVHGNTARPPPNRIPDEVRKRVLSLARGKYAGFNDQHLCEKLREVEGLVVSRPSLQRVLRAGGVAAVRKRRARAHRGRRERKAQAGLMLLWDGSRHDWLEGRGPMLCLMAAVDDATGELLPGAHFVEQECAAGYLRVVYEVAKNKGLPHAIYMDRHGSLKRNDSSWTLEEELCGKQEPTQVGRALEALGIRVIFANSPQAKGRVERQWGTLQDRLCSELRLARAGTKDEANALLAKYLLEHNRRFAKPAREATSAWRKVAPSTELEQVCAFRYEAVVQNDNTVRIAGKVFDIPAGPNRRGYAKAHAEVRQLLDGSWCIWIGGLCVAKHAGAIGEPLVAHKRRKRSIESRTFRKRVMGLTASLP